MPIRCSLAAALLSLAALGLAPPARAGLLAQAELTLRLVPVVTPQIAELSYPGTTAAGSASSPASVSLLPGNGFAGADLVGVIQTTLTGQPHQVIATIDSNAAASFTGTPLNGVARFDAHLCIGALTAPFLCTYQVPFVFGTPGTHMLIGHVATGGFPIPVTVSALQFTTGVVTAGGTGGPPILLTSGSKELTPAGGGSLSLVTPIAISFPGLPGQRFGTFLGTARLELHFIPEPGALAMFGSGALALLAAGRRRIRR